MTRWLLIWVYLTAALPGPAGTVLCIGEDGHVQIEAVGNNCCSDTIVANSNTGPDTPSPAVISSVEDCGHCIDISLKGDQAHIVQRTGNSETLNVFFTFSEVVFLQTAGPVGRFRSLGDSLNESCLYDHAQSLRTVCLLI